MLKAPIKKAVGGGVDLKTDSTDGRVLGMSVNIPTKVSCLM